jgi:predicted transcriptional regulator of viral defense system
VAAEVTLPAILTIEDVATYLRVHPRTAYAYLARMEARGLPNPRIGEGRFLADVLAANVRRLAEPA